jgi:hypothetical protein
MRPEPSNVVDAAVRANSADAVEHALSESSSPELARQPTRSARAATPHPVWWVIAASLVVIATTMVTRPGGQSPSGAAFAQPTTSGGARGVFAFSGQLSKGSYGVYMVDVDAMTMWVYEFQPAKACLRLAAARTWRYDRYLESHNLCDLPPDVVEKMVDDQRQFRLQSSEKQMP